MSHKKRCNDITFNDVVFIFQSVTGPLFPIDEESEENLTESDHHHGTVGDPPESAASASASATPATARSTFEEMDRLEEDHRLLRTEINRFQEQFGVLSSKLSILEQVDREKCGSVVGAGWTNGGREAETVDESDRQDESLIGRIEAARIALEQSDACRRQLTDQMRSMSERSEELVTVNQRMEQELMDLNAKLQGLTSDRCSCEMRSDAGKSSRRIESLELLHLELQQDLDRVNADFEELKIQHRVAVEGSSQLEELQLQNRSLLEEVDALRVLLGSKEELVASNRKMQQDLVSLNADLEGLRIQHRVAVEESSRLNALADAGELRRGSLGTEPLVQDASLLDQVESLELLNDSLRDRVEELESKLQL